MYRFIFFRKFPNKVYLHKLVIITSITCGMHKVTHRMIFIFTIVGLIVIFVEYLKYFLGFTLWKYSNIYYSWRCKHINNSMMVINIYGIVLSLKKASSQNERVDKIKRVIMDVSISEYPNELNLLPVKLLFCFWASIW